MKFLKAFGQFWYEFIIGDDWKIAAGVVVALALTLTLLFAGVNEQAVTILGALLVFAIFTLVLCIDLKLWRRS